MFQLTIPQRLALMEAMWNKLNRWGYGAPPNYARFYSDLGDVIYWQYHKRKARALWNEHFPEKKK